MSTNQITMKLTDIDLSSLAEVAAAVTLLEHVHRELATGGTPLPSLPPACQEFVVNPAPNIASLPDAESSAKLKRAQVAMLAGVDPSAPVFHGFDTVALAADAEKLRGMGVDPLPASGIALIDGPAVALTAADFGTAGLAAMDAASVFGGATAQSAAPLPHAPATAGAAASPTAPVAPPASGALPALPALAPLPAPSAAALVASVVQPSPAGGVELDTDGLPWDARIHAGTKRKNADGRWTAKKGINDPDLVPRVVKQLREMMAAGEAARRDAQIDAATPQVHIPVAAVGAQPFTLGQLAALPPAPAVMPTLPEQPVLPANPTSTLAALQAAMTPASAAPAPTTFQDFMTALTVEVQAGRVPIEALGAACQPLGGVSALNAKPELIPVAWASLKAKYPRML